MKKWIAIFVFTVLFSLNGYIKAEAVVNPEVKKLVEEYVQQMVYASLMETTSEIIQRTITENKLAVLPPIALQGMQQAVLQCFKQNTTQELVRGAYESGRDLGLEQIENGLPKDQIQVNIKNSIDRELSGIREEVIFRRIIEEILKQSLIQTQQTMMMQSAQRQAQIAAIQQRQRMLQQAIVQQYQKAIQQQFSAQMNNQLRGAYQQQYNQIKAQEDLYRQRIEHQYQQEYIQSQQQQQLGRSSGSGVY